MKQFKIYVQPRGACEAVKEGWSWPAFLFGFLWALIKKLWKLALGLFAVSFAIGYIGAAAGGNIERAIEGVMGFGGMLMAIVFGIFGNAWREDNLRSRGFEHKETVTAVTPEQAIAIFIEDENS